LDCNYDDGFCTLMTDSGDLKEDLSLPKDEDSVDLVKDIKAGLEAGKELIVNVISALGKEKIVSCKEKTNNWTVIELRHNNIFTAFY